MLVKMKTQYASARGNAAPGQTIGVPDEEAKQLIAGGYAVPAGGAAQAAVVSKPEEAPVETPANGKRARK